jgi:heme/copper-type cytochrome/quinol oxidase subunit 3
MPRDEVVIRPGTIVLTLALMGISTLFGGLCAAYLYTLISTHVEAPFPPVFFLINIPILLGATWVLKKSLQAFDASQPSVELRNQLFCILLTMLFIGLQIAGWFSFFRNIPVSASHARSFLFVLSALHLLHVLAGLPFLSRYLWMNRGTHNRLRFPAVHRRGFLKGLVRYWNYLDILWILLVVILSFGFALKWL